MNCKKIHYLIVMCLFSVSLMAKDSFFELESKTDRKLIIDFNLDSYEIQRTGDADQIILSNTPFDNEKKFSTFVQLVEGQEYNVDFDIVSSDLYSFESNEDMYNPDLNYTTKEHIFRGVRIVEISFNPFILNRSQQSINIINRASIEVNLSNSVPDNQNIRYSKTFLDMVNDFSINPIGLSSRDLN